MRDQKAEISRVGDFFADIMLNEEKPEKMAVSLPWR
jgi:hypothetical protein